jgi:putative chitinase
MSDIVTWFNSLISPAPTPVPVATVAPAVVIPVSVIHGLEDALRAAAPHADPKIWVPALTPALLKCKATSPKEISAWLGQAAVEAGPAFATLSENTNYTSAARLLAVFPREFTPALAAQCAGHPEKIASVCYANRMGNGSIASGEGNLYKGKGLCQITGKTTYQKFAAWCGMTVEAAADYAVTPAGAAMTMAWYWEANNLGEMADDWNIAGITRAINGPAMLGQAARLAASNAALATFLNGVL